MTFFRANVALLVGEDIVRLLVLSGILSLVGLGCFGLCLTGSVIYLSVGGREVALGVR